MFFFTLDFANYWLSLRIPVIHLCSDRYDGDGDDVYIDEVYIYDILHHKYSTQNVL